MMNNDEIRSQFEKLREKKLNLRNEYDQLVDKHNRKLNSGNLEKAEAQSFLMLAIKKSMALQIIEQEIREFKNEHKI